MRLYVASSWRNPIQPEVVDALRKAGHEVYDFRNPKPGNHGFRWSDIDPEYKNWDSRSFRAALGHPIAEAGFALDWNAMQWAEGGVLVLPSGRSAHLEAGYFVGAGKPLFILLDFVLDAQGGPELMYKMATLVTPSMDELINALGAPGPSRSEWEMAKHHFDETRQAYQDLEGLPGANTTVALRTVFDPLARRFNSGERTRDLYDAMRSVE